MLEQHADTSVIVTVKDVVHDIEDLLLCLSRQTRRPGEIVIVDGGSTDGTWDALCSWRDHGRLPLRIERLEGANIAQGRNRAISLAAGPRIATTDAGVILPRHWLAALMAPMDEGARLVAGFFGSNPRGAFETALGATTLPELRDVDPAGFLPSARSSAFLKSVWLDVGGYPEWLDFCEDLVFDLRAVEAAGPWVFAPEAFAYFAPRPSLDSFVHQYYRYARGDGKADLWRARHAVRYIVYLGLLPVLLAGVVAGNPAAAPALVVGSAAALFKPYRRLVRQWGHLPYHERARALLFVPLIRVAGDLAKMAGYPAGWYWRWRHRPPAWRPQPQASA